MKRVAVSAVLALALIFGYGAAKAMSNEMMSASEKTDEANNLQGTWVKNSKGEDLGTITEVVTGPWGRVGFVVISYWISDDTQKRVAVPYGALSCEGKECALNASKKTFDAAPVFVLEDDLTGEKLAGHIYRYFGVQPYWTEEGVQK